MTITKKQIEKSISDGNINPKMLKTFFNDMKLRSYSYDYNMQKELVNYGERKIPASKGRSFLAKGVFNDGYDRVIEFTLDYQFTVPGEKEAYLRSKVFNAYMDFETFNNNKKYFRFVPLIFADNKLLFNYRMQAYNERINIFFLDKEFDKNVKELNILFIPDSIISIIDPKITDFNGTNITFDKFESYKEFKKVSKYIAFWIHKETGIPYLVPSVIKNQEDKFFTIGDLLPTDVSKFKLMLVGINNLYSITQIRSNVQWISYEKQNMPIPKDNNIIFIMKDKNFYPNDGTVELKEYYPNIYEVINPNRYNIIIMSLYENNSSNEHIYYDDESLLYGKVQDIFREYENGTVPDKLKEFKPLSWDYSISDFLNKKSYKDIDFDDNWDSFIYKMETISKMLKKWNLLYEEYEKRTYGFLTGWYHNLGKFDNIDRKLRNNVNEDIDDVSFEYAFKEPQYVFTYMKDESTGEANSFCFFIDGRYTIPTKIVVYRGIQYVYFPKKLFKKDTVVEVERFDGNYFYKTIKIKKNTIEETIEMNKNIAQVIIADKEFGNVELDLGENGTFNVVDEDTIKTDKTDELPITINNTGMLIDNVPEFIKGTVLSLNGILKTRTVANNIFLADPLGNFVTNKEVRVFIIDKELGEVEVNLDTSVFIIEKDSEIKLVPVNYDYDEITVCCNNATYQFIERESGDDFLYGREMEINLNYRQSIGKVKKDISHRLRIFNNQGRLIPKRAYNIYAHENFNDLPRFNVPIDYGTEEDFIISYIGYDEKLIYHSDSVPDTGFIDLRGILSRPFNLAYHDLYLDGYRLTKYDIEMLTPFTFVIKTIEKYDTINNIEIYEKIHVSDDLVKFKWGEKSQYLMDTLFQQKTEFYDNVIRSLDKIEVSGNVKDIDTVRDWLFSFFNDYFPYHYMDPDYRYDLEAYHHIFDDKTGRILLDPDDRVKYIKQVRTLYYFDHDKSIDLYGDKLENYPSSPVTLRNIDESVLIPGDVPVISEEEYARKGYWIENYERIYGTLFNPVDSSFSPTRRKDNEIYHSKLVETIETKEFKRKEEQPDYYRYPLL